MAVRAASGSKDIPPLGESSKATRPAIEAIDLTKTFSENVQAAKEISLLADPGEIVGVVGPNGAGKSTTLKMLATLLQPTSGSARICGISISDRRAVRPMLGVALQDVGLDPLMTGAEHFKVQAAISRLNTDQVKGRVGQLINRFDLGAFVDRYVGAYSGGTQRRLALALALLADPTVIILDEPTAGLDPRARRNLWEVLRDLKADDRTVLFSTQYLEEADALCDRLYLIDQGEIVVSGTPAELKQSIAETTLGVTLDRQIEPRIIELLKTLPVKANRVDGREISLRLEDSAVAPTNILKAIEAQGVGIKSFQLTPASLDDVFFHYTKHSYEPEPLEKTSMDLGTRTHRGGGRRWK